jgi:hypothetical protein
MRYSNAVPSYGARRRGDALSSQVACHFAVSHALPFDRCLAGASYPLVRCRGVPLVLNGSGRWRALWVDLETAREQPDLAAALSTVLGTIDRALRVRHAELSRPDVAEIEAALRDPATALVDYFGRLTALEERPLVLLLDEADGPLRPASSKMHGRLRALV